MIKTTKEILEMCDEFWEDLEVKRENNNVVLNDPRLLMNKVWINQDKLLELIDDLTVNYNTDNLKRKGYVNAELLKKTIKGGGE